MRAPAMGSRSIRQEALRRGRGIVAIPARDAGSGDVIFRRLGQAQQDALSHRECGFACCAIGFPMEGGNSDGRRGWNKPDVATTVHSVGP